MSDQIKTLNKHEKEYINLKSLRSYSHTLYTISCNTLGLSPYENKRL